MKKKIFIATIFLVVLASIWAFFLSIKMSRNITIENPAEKELSQEENLSSAVKQNQIEQPEKNEASITEENLEEIEMKIEPNKEESTDDEEIESSNFIKQNLVSWGFTQSYSRKIDTIIIHSSYDALGDDPFDIDGILKEYEMYGVSAHYLIDRKGSVFQLVKENNIAYHAGKSSVPDGRSNVNDFSIGIEMVNTKKDEITSSQYESLNNLIGSIEEKNEIKYILGHNEIAPDRKDDPWNFDWDKIKSR